MGRPAMWSTRRCPRQGPRGVNDGIAHYTDANYLGPGTLERQVIEARHSLKRLFTTNQRIVSRSNMTGAPGPRRIGAELSSARATAARVARVCTAQVETDPGGWSLRSGLITPKCTGLVE
jgi:hypothetical protein